MDKDFLIQLTNNLYKLTLLFPKKEPLRYKIREVADDILANPKEKYFEILNNFFEVAEAQNWVSQSEISAIKKDYDNLREAIKNQKPEKEETGVGIREVSARYFADRQERILTILKEKGRAQVWEIKEVFPKVSKRTLRRDFESLLRQGAVERIGERNNTFYQIKIG